MTAQPQEQIEAADLPDDVREALGRLISTEVGPGRCAVAEAAWADRPMGAAANQWVADELVVVEAAEKVKSWADARALAALARLHEAVGLVVEENAASTAFYVAGAMDHAAVVSETMTAAVDEVALATGLAVSAVSGRVQLAMDAARDQRCAPVTAALARGELSLDRAVRTQTAVEGLDPEIARAVCARLLEPGRDGKVRSHRWFLRELRRQVALHTPDETEARADALSRRDAYGWLESDGTGTMRIAGGAGRVTSALDRLDELARALRQAGDSRTLAQLRSDLALDLLLFGWADPLHLPDDAPETSRRTFVGQPPVAHTTLVVSLSTLLGLDEQPGELVGHGFVSATQARQIACVAGSTWRRLVVDPADGTALELSTTRYRPTAAMAEQVAALDGVCQAPGCTVPASRCDLDHSRPWPSGDTSTANLRSRHRRHHNHRTRRTWTTQDHDDGSTSWRTVSGREYLSYRHRYDDPHNQPVSAAEVERAEPDPPPF